MAKQNPWTDEHINQLKELFHKKYKIIDIAKTLNRSQSNIHKKCRELGLKTQMAILMGEQKNARAKGLILCRGCKTEKLPEHFGNRDQEKRYFRCLCIECEAKSALQRYRNKKIYSLEETLHRRAYQASRRAKNKKLDFYLTDNDLIEIYNKQEGKCYYSGVFMEKIPKIDNYYNLSIDRVDSKKGYTKENIVLCCDSINTMKNAMPYNVFIDICEKIVLHQKRQVNLPQNFISQS